MQITVEALEKEFPEPKAAGGIIRALDKVSFTVQNGEVFGFVGANGAGKSTTMRIIMGVLSATKGKVLLDGNPAGPEQRMKIGYMPSERGLYGKMKVDDQLIYFARLHGLNKEDASKQTAFWMKRLGISEHAKKKLETLSTGNQQRVQLAAALVHKPEALILDEPFSGLDPLAVQVMSSVLREFANNGASVIFSSHQLELIDELSTRVGIISHGVMVAQGSPAELRKEANAPETVVIPTPLSSIFGDLVSEGDNSKGVRK